ncbi:Hypothetical protein D9617_20g027240 [Elsinoe fawcettii]|nr:Hypothetical protein D9617_20g027240 [Elsinoe fawcettii]
MHSLLLVIAALVPASLQGCLSPSAFNDIRSGCPTQQIPLSGSSGGGDDKYEPFTSDFNDYVEAIREKWNTPGIAVSVVYGNDTWAKGFGYADVESKTPVTPYTLFQGASTTKSFIGSLFALLVQDNETYQSITWESKLHDVTPKDFVLASPYESSQTTFLDALSHRSGMPRHDFSWLNNRISIRHQTQILRHLPPSAPFRTKWQYCNLMYAAVANAIHTLTGKPSTRILKEWLLEPLGMKHSYTSIEDTKECRKLEPTCVHSSQYAFTNKTAGYVKFSLDVLPPFHGAGGLISNVYDYAIWTRTLMTAGGPVNEEGHEVIRQPLSWAPGDPGQPLDGATFYGLGSFGATYRGHRIFFHNGAIGGFWSRWTYFPDLHWGFTVMQNSPSFSVDIVGWKLIMDFLDVPENERKDMDEYFWTGVHKTMQEMKTKPKELYPNVPSPPILPSLAPDQYIGDYEHPAYGNITLELGYPKNSMYQQRVWFDTPTTIVMHLKTDLLGIQLVFHHVSGDHWLVEQQDVDDFNYDIPTRFMKARTSIGPDGKVEAMFIVLEPEVKREQGWARFVKVG